MLSCLAWEDTMNYRKYDRIQASGVDRAIVFEKKNLQWFLGAEECLKSWGNPRKGSIMSKEFIS